jgi:hypothetical protein
MRFIYLFAAMALVIALGFLAGFGVNSFTDLDPMTSLGVGMIIVSFIICGVASLEGD